MDNQNVPVFDLITGGSKEELFASLQLGDNQHRRNYEAMVVVNGTRAAGNSKKIQLRIDSLMREDGSGHCWCFEGYAMPSGRWVRVQGFLRTDREHMVGHISAVPAKCCPSCSWSGVTNHKRCGRCGAEMSITSVPTFV